MRGTRDVVGSERADDGDRGREDVHGLYLSTMTISAECESRRGRFANAPELILGILLYQV